MKMARLLGHPLKAESVIEACHDVQPYHKRGPSKKRDVRFPSMMTGWRREAK